MEILSPWAAKAIATSSISGKNSVSFSFEGSLAFTVFVALGPDPQPEESVIPANSVAGRMVGTFDLEVTTETMQMRGEGTAGWTLAGTFDPVTESISIAIRSSGAEAKGLQTLLADVAHGATPVAQPFSTAFNWGWPAPRPEDPSTVLNVMSPPAVPVIPSEREVDLVVVHSLPQTGIKEFKHVSIDLKDPEPQTITQTFEDEAGLGTRTTTWTFALIPQFNIERDDRGPAGRYSFVSTDSISLRLAIPGVTVPESGWARLTSWQVKAMGPFSGSGVPDHTSAA